MTAHNVLRQIPKRAALNRRASVCVPLRVSPSHKRQARFLYCFARHSFTDPSHGFPSHDRPTVPAETTRVPVPPLSLFAVRLGVQVDSRMGGEAQELCTVRGGRVGGTMFREGHRPVSFGGRPWQPAAPVHTVAVDGLSIAQRPGRSLVVLRHGPLGRVMTGSGAGRKVTKPTAMLQEDIQ